MKGERPDISGPWDALVVGTGMGGSTLGHALVTAGWRVLFCEMGRSTLDPSQSLRGGYAEAFASFQGSEKETLMRAGRWSEEIEDRSRGGHARRFVPFVGSGTGGSSAVYGMALERLAPSDFSPRRNYPGNSDSSLPDEWPISYGDLVPYYQRVEALYRVRGEADPLRAISGEYPPPPPMSESGVELAEHLRGKGLHPYRLPLACNFVAECAGCQSFLCARRCKIDSAIACLEPALGDGRTLLIDECEVTRIEADAHRVNAAVCRWRGSEVRITAKIIVLAAGALATPALLLRSATPEWPDGLANQSGLVGRNLMRHYIDLYAIRLKSATTSTANHKELGCGDFCLTEGGKFGSIQSFGHMPPGGVLALELQDEIEAVYGKAAGRILGIFRPIMQRLLDGYFSRRLVLATIMEDLPYADNRLFLAPGADAKARMAFRYLLRPSERTRIAKFREIVTDVLGPFRPKLMKQAESNRRLAHVCGTCRFGHDPETSVLDANNKAHGVSNLYIVDASFFPSSGGVNPALTIAANALRVADHLIREHGSGARPGGADT